MKHLIKLSSIIVTVGLVLTLSSCEKLLDSAGSLVDDLEPTLNRAEDEIVNRLENLIDKIEEAQEGLEEEFEATVEEYKSKNGTEEDVVGNSLKFKVNWNTGSSGEVDYDIVAFTLDKAGKALEDGAGGVGFVFYNQTSMFNSAITVSEDARGTSSNRASETLKIELDDLPDEVEKIVVVIEAYINRTDNVKASDMYCTVADGNYKEFMIYDLRESDVSYMCSEVYRSNESASGWKIKHIAADSDKELSEYCADYNIEASNSGE